MTARPGTGMTSSGGVPGPAPHTRGDRELVEEPDEPLFRIPRADPATLGAGLRLLRHRNWALALLGAVALSIVFVGLGRWQYHRHEAKVERRDLVRANYAAVPVPVRDLLGPAAVDPADEWRPVTATGTYQAAGRLAVRNRPLDGDAGFHDLAPLLLDDGTLFLVDRGWLPASDTGAQAPSSVPALPSGRVAVTARVRPFEPATTRTAPAGQVSRIDRSQSTRAVGAAGVEGAVLGGYGVLAVESPTSPRAPVLLPAPDVGLGVHLAYAYQWWIFAAALYGVLGTALYREAERRRGPAGR